jgi:hypothetical protein
MVLLLITKFGKAGKLYYLVSYFRLSGFSNIQNRNREGDRPEDLKIKDILSPGKILEGDKEQLEKNSKPKVEVPKTKGSGFGNQSAGFYR